MVYRSESAICRVLCVMSSKYRLYRWKLQIEDQRQGKVLVEDEREELKRLRKEVKNLRMEKEILKKASAFFAKEMK